MSLFEYLSKLTVLPTWQQLILIITLLFKNEIKSLLNRIIKFGKDGISFETNTQTAPPVTNWEEESKINHLLNSATNLITLINNKEAITKYLSSQGITDPIQTTSVLIDELAHVYLTLRCERIYNIIFGSQILLLKKLLNNNEHRLSKVEIDHHFHEVTKTYPESYKTWNSNDYLAFLINSELIGQQNGYYFITNFGADFMTWLLRRGLTENKPL